MKKSTFLILSLVSFIVLMFSTITLFTSCDNETYYTIKAAYIGDVGSNKLFAEIDGNNYLYCFGTEGVKIIENGNGSASLECGDIVNIVYNGKIEELYPSIPDGVTEIDILTDETPSVAPAFIKALSDVFGDSDEGIEFIGLEFGSENDIDILSDPEKDAIAYMLSSLSSTNGYTEVYITTFDELRQAGQISEGDSNLMYIENGIYMKLDITEANESEIIFSVEKWRSSDSACGMKGCVIKLTNNDRSEYTPADIWIS